MNTTTEQLVSIIMPAYNCEPFIGETIQSVIAQSYHNWELIVVDDCSKDRTLAVIESYAVNESRIRSHPLQVNRGAAIARNTAIELAQGKYIAFLDSDDLWTANKLTKQINFMRTNSCTFTSTSYMKIAESGQYLNKTIIAAPTRDYLGVLKTCPGNSTVIYDAEVLGKFMTPNIKNREDYAMWLEVIKKAHVLFGIAEPLGSHRIRQGSLSSQKWSLVRYHWEIYRELERLSWFKSLYLVLYWIYATVCKRR